MMMTYFRLALVVAGKAKMDKTLYQHQEGWLLDKIVQVNIDEPASRDLSRIITIMISRGM